MSQIFLKNDSPFYENQDILSLVLMIEEALEASHDDWDALWVGRNYKRDLNNPNYASQAHEAIVKYNSGHVGNGGVI